MQKTYFGLKEYSAIAGCFMLLHNTMQGQVVYTDLEPDIIIDEDGEFFVLDLDVNEMNDFIFFSTTFNIYSESIGITNSYQRLIAGAYVSQNAIAGSYDIKYEPYHVFTWYFPFAIEVDDTISENLSFQNFTYQFLGYWQHSFLFSFWTTREGGNWYPEVTDHYLGLRFVDEENCLRYGWARCSVTDSGRVLTIKDYAYEVQCDNPILAGDTMHLTSLQNAQPSDITIYSFGKNIYIQLPQQDISAVINVYSIDGQLVKTQVMSAKTMIINMGNEVSGVYVVEVVNNQGKFVKKVYR